MKKLEYPFKISILSPEEGGGYLIEFPDLPGCISDGETLDETIVNGKDALFCWIETAKQYGDEIPSPSSSEDRTTQDENPSQVVNYGIHYKRKCVSPIGKKTTYMEKRINGKRRHYY